MKQPEDFEVKVNENYVCRLRKSLYDLKQAPRQWYKKFELVMGEQVFRKTTSNHCVFIQKFSYDDFIILLLYVDDMLIVGKSAQRIEKLKQQLSQFFPTKDLGPTKQIFGIQIIRDRKTKKLYLSQEKYINKRLQKFNMDKSKIVNSPFTTHIKLSIKQSLSTNEEKKKIWKESCMPPQWEV